MLLTIVLVIFLLYALVVLYYGLQYRRLPFQRPSSYTILKFSIIIPARNEAANLPGLLQAVERQAYPRENFEIIVVDDHSTDNTMNVASSFQGVRVISAGEGRGNAFKKKALEDGIAAANYEWIVCTDADCIPGPGWLSSLAASIKDNEAVFVAAPVQLTSDNSVLGVFQEMDFMVLQAITAVVVSKEQMSMCNGANIAYKKQAFLEVNGFAGIDQIASGDDMLLMYKIWQRYPGGIAYLKQQEAIVQTAAEKTWAGFIRQRIRWASKATHYQDKRIFPVLLLVYLCNLCFPVLLVASSMNSVYWKYFISLWLAKTLVEWPLFLGAAKFFSRRALVPLFFFFQPLHIMYTLISGFFGQMGKYEWKGRRVS